MISIARTLGAPDKVPAGKAASTTSRAEWSSAIWPATVDSRCMMWL